MEFFMLLSALIFGFFHSFLARDQIKQRLNSSKYTIVYNTIAIVSFTLLMIIERLLIPYGKKVNVVFNFPEIKIFGLFIGCLFFFGGLVQYQSFKMNHKAHPFTSGFYSFSRHPTYFGAIIALLSLSLFHFKNTIQIVNSMSLVLYLVIGSSVEDYLLTKRDNGYCSYKNVCGRYFPWKLTHIGNFWHNCFSLNKKNKSYE